MTSAFQLEHLRFANEDRVYRIARNALLEAEMELRRQVERVAAHRRALPPGCVVPRDYVFERLDADGLSRAVHISELFGKKTTLALYSFMYGPDVREPCGGARTCSTVSME
jgi:predicted dithiol-disulfide oxidoreductase (DUF899 family)